MDARIESAHVIAEKKLNNLLAYMEINKISIGVSGRRDGTLFVSIHEDGLLANRLNADDAIN